MHKSKYMNMAGDVAMNKLMPKPDISITISMAGGGGLSSIAPRMNIGGQPYRLSYIDPRQAKVGGPVIRRVSGVDLMDADSFGQDGDFFGGYTDEMAGVVDDVDMYGTATPDMDYTEDDFISYADIPGSLLEDTEDAEDAQAASTTPTDASYLPDVAYMGDFAFAPDPQGRVGLMGPDEVAGVDIAQTYLSPDPESSELGQYEDVSGLERFFAGLPVIGKALNLSKDRQRFVSDKELENRYGERAGFAAKLNNRANQWAAGINKVKSDIDKRSEEEDPKTPEEIEKEEREGLLEVAEKTFDKGSFVENKGQGIPGYAASYGLASLFGAMGLLGTAEIDGIPVHVHEDGSVTPVSPEDEPGFDFSKMNITSDKEALPTRKQYRATTPKTTTEDIVEEEKTTPIEGEKRLASLGGLQDIFKQSYGRPFRTI